MDDTDLLADADRAVAAWAVGDADAVAALEQVCGSLAAVQGVSCVLALGEEGGDGLVNAPEEPAEAALVVSVAAHARSNRAIYTRFDEVWRALFSAVVGSGAAAAEGSAPAACEWVACEPVKDGEGALHGVVVVLGKDEGGRDRVLSALPDLARLCAAVLVRERQGAVAAKVTHRLNNLLSGVLANVEFASSLVQGQPSEGPLLASATPAVRADFVSALQNAAAAARQLGLHVGEIDRLVRSRKTA